MHICFESLNCQIVVDLHKLLLFTTTREFQEKIWISAEIFPKQNKNVFTEFLHRRFSYLSGLIWLASKTRNSRHWRLEKVNMVGLRWILAVAEYLLSPGGIHPRTCHKINLKSRVKSPGVGQHSTKIHDQTCSLIVQPLTFVNSIEQHMIPGWSTASCGGPLFS